MKILHLAYDAGGIHTRLYQDIIAAYRNDGHEVVECYLLGNAVAPVNSTDTNAVSEVNLGYKKKQLKGLRRLIAVKKLRQYIIENNFEAIITHRRKPAELAARATKGLPLKARFAVWHDEGEFDRWRKRLGVAKLLKDFILIGVSAAVREDILKSGAGFSEERVIAINNAVDVEVLERALLDQQVAREKLQIPQDAFVFGTIGRLVPKKAHAEIIKAFAELASIYPQSLLVIIGGGRLETELKELIAQLNLADQVRLTGPIPGAVNYLKALDVFLLPSYREGLPIALLEAACAKLPAIVSNIGGNIVVVGDTQQIIQAGDIAALNAAMVSALKSESALLKNRGQLLYERVRQYFDRPVMMVQYQKLLR